MNFYSVRDLRTESKSIWESLANDGEAVITNNGKPTAVMLSVANDNFEEVLKAVRQVRAMIAFNNIRAKVAENNAYMTEEEINAEIAAYREERRKCPVENAN